MQSKFGLLFTLKPEGRRIEKMCLRIVLSSVVILAGLTGCSDNRGQPAANNSYRDVSVDQFIEMIAHKDFTLINTHIPYEGEIPGTDLLIPFNEIDRHKAELPGDKTAGIVVYCKAGPMGDIAAQRLVEMGYSHVINLKDGMNAWEKTGRSLQFRSQ
jgi:rhodanese-related sulfurtransferase